jgi:hypothetical protein
MPAGLRCAIRCYTRFVGYFENGPYMDSELNVLIVNPLLGTRGLIDLAGKLHASVEVAEIGDVHGSMPCVLSAGVTARLQRDPRVWDWVISVRDGAGVAAQMVSRGQAKHAVLMDPLVGLPELPGVPEALIADLYLPSEPPSERFVEALTAMTDTYVPDAYFEMVSEARFGADPGWRRWQGLYAEVYRSLLPMDPVLEHTPEWWAEEWVDAWRTNPDAVRPWFTQVHRGLGEAVSSAVGLPITVQPWNELAWLTDPSVVADALNQEFERPRPDHVEG